MPDKPNTPEAPTAPPPPPSTSATGPYYVTTPIYYVNDRPHIGHCYTTLLADVAARMHRLLGRDVFFLTGTDEHAEKVVKTAQERGLSPMEWATQNADRFRAAFDFMGFTHDDFVRTSEARHKERASAYIQRLVDSGDIELGDYEGWYDPSQEEYVTETVAKEHEYNSPVTGRPLEKRVEQNYFFRLDKYEGWLRERFESADVRVLPEARRNEVLGRLRDGLQKVPVSRRIKEGDADWGIRMPNDPEHRVYVWIEALCNYLTMVDEPARRKYWPRPDGAQPEVVHLMAKDILWFHAVIWPAMLHALGETPPSTVYAHAYWIAEGRKMSKSLGNFIEIDQLEAYGERYSLDSVRWFLTTQGPLGATDADFAHARFVEVYNADLANGIGNAASRVGNMIAKYFDGEAPDAGGCTSLTAGEGESAATYDWASRTQAALDVFTREAAGVGLAGALNAGLGLSNDVDAYIGLTRPFSIAKDLDGDPVIEGMSNREALAAILAHCAEALRIASLLLWPAMPEKMGELWRNWNCSPLNDPEDPRSGFKAPLSELAQWGGAHSIQPGQRIAKGEALFMRADVKEDPPQAAGAQDAGA